MPRRRPRPHAGCMTQTLTVLWKGQLVTVVVLSAVGLVLSGLLVLSDLESRGEMFDGLGTFLGLLFAGVSLVPGVPALVALVLHRRRPVAAVVLALVLGVVVAVAGLLLAGALGSLWALLCLVLGGSLAATSASLFRQDSAVR